MFKNALISVSDKTGLVEFLRPFADQGMRIVSTGGTYQYLMKNGFSVIDISEQTGFPEVMGGRVKTLHPKVHMALLSRENNSDDEELLKLQNLMPFDLLVCNLYPFENTVLEGRPFDELIEKIDIGGPSMLRSAAKNFSRIAVVCDPHDYSWVTKKSPLTLEDRKKLSARVFAHTSVYDSLVAEKLGAGWGEDFSFAGHNTIELRYGENPQQQAKWYRNLGDNVGLHSAIVLQGKPLSYNNILDLDAATLLVRELNGPSVVAVKHNNPCGVASRETLILSLDSAINADPVSVFGSVIALNKIVQKAEAERLSEIFLECVVAPDFSDEALEIFARKKNVRVLKWPDLVNVKRNIEIRGVQGGFLIQQPDNLTSSIADWKFLSEKPNDSVLADLIFAEKICSSLKSNSIAIVKDGQSLGLGMGQVNRVEAVGHAIDRMKTHHGNILQTVLASDAFFPFVDSIEKAAKVGVKWVLQPGGSLKDSEVFVKAKDLGINMIITGKRHFRH